MHIVLVAPFGWQPKGTVRVRAYPIAQALVERGHGVTILIPPWDDPAAAGQKWLLNGVHIANLDLPPLPLAAQLAAMTRSIVKAIQSSCPDIVHVFKPKGISGAVAQTLSIMRRFSGSREQPRIVVDTDDWEGSGGWNEVAGYSALAGMIFAWQETHALRAADAVTVASRELQRLVARHVGFPEERILYAPNSADDRTAEASDGRVQAVRRRLGIDGVPVVLLTTRFFEFDPNLVAQAWALVRAEMPVCRLVVVGDALRGEDRAFRSALERIAEDDGATFTGWVQPDELGALYRIAACSWFPTRDSLINRARCSVKLAEAIAAGVPVVAERVGQAREYVRHGETGYTVEPGDTAGFAAATLLLLRSPELRRRMGSAGKALMQGPLAWNRIVHNVEAAYSGRPPLFAP